MKSERAEARAVAADNELVEASKRFAKEISHLKAGIAEKDAHFMGGCGSAASLVLGELKPPKSPNLQANAVTYSMPNQPSSKPALQPVVAPPNIQPTALPDRLTSGGRIPSPSQPLGTFRVPSASRLPSPGGSHSQPLSGRASGGADTLRANSRGSDIIAQGL